MSKNLGPIALVVSLLILLGAAAYFSWDVWVGLDGVEMSGHGWTALVLGVVFSVLLGVGLMFLVFYSHRKGYDDGEGHS